MDIRTPIYKKPSYYDQPDDTTEYWLNKKEDFNRCKADCKHDECIKTLAHSFPKRMIRIASFSDMLGIEYYQWISLCDKSQQAYHTWYFDTVWSDRPEKKVSIEVFGKMLNESSLKHMLDGASACYHKLLENYSSKTTSISRDELEAQRKYMQNIEEKYNQALKELSESIKEEQARRAGYPV